MPDKRHLAAVMFTDTVGFTSSVQADEAGALSRLREQERLVRPLLAEYDGREIKSTGDGFLVEFDSALKATQCAVEIQRRMHDRNSRPNVAQVQLRIGIHLGDVEEHGSDIFGDAVNIASRVEPLAEPGGVCVSEQVFSQIRNKVPFQIEKQGPRVLKGVREPVQVYRIALPWLSREATTPSSGPPRIAVLPFASISPDPRDEYFADGLTEEMISVLSQISGLRVISRTSVNQYKGTSKALAQIGSELGADSILEGSVRKAGDQLRIAVQLIDTHSDEHRWSRTYDRKLENVFEIQAEVAEHTADALKVQLLSPERHAIQDKPTSNMEAYEAYLRGIQASLEYGVRYSSAADVEAASFFEDAIRRDARFSAAYARLALHLIHVMGESRSAGEVVPRVRVLVARALELSPDSSEAHEAGAALAMQVDHDWARAEAGFQQAIQLNLSNSSARREYGFLLGVLQRYDEATKQQLAALEQDPLSYAARWALAAYPAFRGDLPTSIRAFEKLMETYPEHPTVRSTLAQFYAFSGRHEDALRAAAPLAANVDQTSREGHALVLAILGRPAEAGAFLADWEGGRLPERYPLSWAAGLAAAMGDEDRALALLERDDREGDRTLWYSYQYYVFDRLRSNPRFAALLRALHLPPSLKRASFPGPAAPSP